MALKRFQVHVDSSHEIVVDNSLNIVKRLRPEVPSNAVENQLAEKLLNICLPITRDQRLMMAIANFPHRLNWDTFLSYKRTFVAEEIIVPGETPIILMLDKPDAKGVYIKQIFDKFFEGFYQKNFGHDDVRNTPWGKKYEILSKSEVINIILPYVLILDLGRRHSHYRKIKALNIVETYQVEFAKFVIENCNQLLLSSRQEKAARTFPTTEIWKDIIAYGERSKNNNLIDMMQQNPSDRKKSYEKFLKEYCNSYLTACSDQNTRNPKISAWINQWQPPLKKSEFTRIVLPRMIALDAIKQLPELSKRLNEVSLEKKIAVTPVFQIREVLEKKFPTAPLPPKEKMRASLVTSLTKIEENPEEENPQKVIPKTTARAIHPATPSKETFSPGSSSSSSTSSTHSSGSHASSSFLTAEVLKHTAELGGRIEIVTNTDGTTTHNIIFPPATSQTSLQSLGAQVNSLTKTLASSPFSPIVSKTGFFQENYKKFQNTNTKTDSSPSIKITTPTKPAGFWNSVTRVFKKAADVTTYAVSNARRSSIG